MHARTTRLDGDAVAGGKQALDGRLGGVAHAHEQEQLAQDRDEEDDRRANEARVEIDEARLAEAGVLRPTATSTDE